MSSPKPMLAHDGKKLAFPAGPEWVIEPKLDGWRWLTHVLDEGEIASYSGRNGSDRSGQAGVIEEVLADMPPDTILDGELVVLGESSPKVATVLAHPHMGVLHYVVFDVLRVNGNATAGLPWNERRAVLEVLAGRFDGIQVTVTDPVGEDRLAQHTQWLADGYEGSVSKRLDSIYVEGKRSRDWIKHKPQSTADAVVIGLEEGEGSWAGGPGAFVLRLLETGAETSCSIPTKVMRAAVAANPEAYVDHIIEVYHHGEIGSDGLLRHPVFSRMRPDLDMEVAA